MTVRILQYHRRLFDDPKERERIVRDVKNVAMDFGSMYFSKNTTTDSHDDQGHLIAALVTFKLYRPITQNKT